MSTVRTPAWLLLLTAMASCSSAVAAEGVGYVTEVLGAGATRGVDGPPLDLAARQVYTDEFAISPGEQVATLPAVEGSSGRSGATLFFPEAGVVVRCDADTVLTVLPAGPLGVAAAVAVQRGSATIVGRASSPAWFVVVSGSQDDGDWVLARGATLQVEPGGSIALHSGEGHLSAGPVPQGPLVDDEGRPAASAPIEEDIPAAVDAWRRLGVDSYTAGISRGAEWIARAEKGDFTPVRESARASAQFFGQRVGGQESAFDQPRTTAVATTPRVAIGILRTPVVNPATPLLESGVPTSVVAGQRFRRTRIIGNPGTSAQQIRVNPFLDPALTLSGRGGN